MSATRRKRERGRFLQCRAPTERRTRAVPPSWTCPCFLILLLGSARWLVAAEPPEAARTVPPPHVFRAGAFALDITPQKFPVVVNGMFHARIARRAFDPLFARALVLDDGSTRLAIVVVDICVMPRELLDQAKQAAQQRAGIPASNILISATHNHSSPSVMPALGSPIDDKYARLLPGLIVNAIQQAQKNLQPARVGWTVVQDFEHTHSRRWILRTDRTRRDPFGEHPQRAWMCPGYQCPDAVGPSGPVDPDLSILAIQTRGGRPLALLANYSMHYFSGDPYLSADWCGRFNGGMEKLIARDGGKPPFVAMMSQGTSGDLMWMDYRKPGENLTVDAYTEGIVRRAHDAYGKIEYRDRVPLAMAERELTLRRRVPDERRLAWARRVLDGLQGREPTSLEELYAREQIYLHQEPRRTLKLQAIRVGDLGMTAIPCEVYGLTGLKIKAQSPLVPVFNISLANGEEGYIPPPEQHRLGGYSTWDARTAGLEVEAEPKIVDAVLGLLEQVSGRPRRKMIDPGGEYAKAILAAKPLAYWRMSDAWGPRAVDAGGSGNHGTYEDGVAFYLEGPQSPRFCGEGHINRAAHFAGGRMKAALRDLGDRYSVEMWIWNGMPNDARPATGYFFSRGQAGPTGAPGDSLGIGGTAASPGRLILSNGNRLNELLTGKSEITLRAWNHVVLVRDGKRVAVYLNGNAAPEISGEIEIGHAPGEPQVFVGGRNDNFANFEGKIDEVAIFNRPLSAGEAARHYAASQ